MNTLAGLVGIVTCSPSHWRSMIAFRSVTGWASYLPL